MRFPIKFIAIVFLLVLNFCKESSVTPEVKATLYQINGCQPSLGKKANNLLNDSCFQYTFFDKLTIDFCVNGNCCPDKNRFLITNKIFKDTITITVKDTADNLCRCTCNYIIHGEFESLNYNSYVIKCLADKNQNYKLLYLQKVFRVY